jgi:hypothetical protein
MLEAAQYDATLTHCTCYGVVASQEIYLDR